MAYLRVANLKKSYQVSKNEKQQVLKGIDIEFHRGEFVALLGESGCGKSTFINIIGGLDFDYTGSVVLDGYFLRDFTEKELDDHRKKKIGFIFQNYNLIKHMTVIENVMVAMTMSSVKPAERLERAKELLKQVGIEEQARKLPNQLSGGQKQRVAIARALANDPEIILADEPTGSLDKASGEAVLKILSDIAMSGKLVIAVTHSQKVASECSRIIKLEDGLIKSDEKIKNINTNTPKPKNIKPKSIGFAELLKLSLNNLLQNRKRSLLVAMGMSIGIAAVVLMFSLSSGIRNFINEEVGTSMNKLQIDVTNDETGSSAFSSSDTVYIESLDGVDYSVESSSLYLTALYKAEDWDEDEYKTILSLSSTYDGFSPSIEYGKVNGEGEILISLTMAYKLGDLTGGTPDYKSILNTGVTLSINGIEKNFTVSGIYDSDGNYDTAYITPGDMDLFYSGSAPVNKIYVFAKDITYVDGIVSDLIALGFTALRQDTLIEDLLSYVDLGTLVLSGISAISLLVSAIMIFIVMFISVVERTKEIGILRAIGARKKDIRRIFIIEAGLLGLIAGIIGCLFSFTIGTVTNAALSSSYSTNFVDNNILYFLAGIAASVTVSIISGLSPAAGAANADPVESLRYE